MSAGVTWVAIAALVLSVISLGWQIFTAVRRRPRIKVGLRREVHYARFTEDGDIVTPDRVTFHVTVQNPGAEAIWVDDVGLHADGVRIGLAGRRPMGMRLAVGSGGLGNASAVNAPKPIELPASIPPRGHVDYKVGDSLTSDHNDGLAFRGFAELYRAGKKPRSIFSKEKAARLQ